MDMVVIDAPNDMATGIQAAIFCVVIGGIVGAGIALAIARWKSTTARPWSSAWHTPFTFALVFQVWSVIFAALLFAGAALLSTELWLRGVLLVNALWTATGVVFWRRLRSMVGPTLPTSVTGQAG